eukprot:Sspe_Gene.33008::Locus_16152_Transcript_1_1_Confidence_1.000_Length_1129::g.33008::m.33008
MKLKLTFNAQLKPDVPTSHYSITIGFSAASGSNPFRTIPIKYPSCEGGRRAWKEYRLPLFEFSFKVAIPHIGCPANHTYVSFGFTFAQNEFKKLSDLVKDMKAFGALVKEAARPCPSPGESSVRHALPLGEQVVDDGGSAPPPPPPPPP